MAPYMSGALPTVYAVCHRLFADNGHNIVFALYLIASFSPSVGDGGSSGISSRRRQAPLCWSCKLTGPLSGGWPFNLAAVRGFVVRAGKAIVGGGGIKRVTRLG